MNLKSGSPTPFSAPKDEAEATGAYSEGGADSEAAGAYSEA